MAATRLGVKSLKRSIRKQIKIGADINLSVRLQKSIDWYPLHVAIDNESLEMASLLLKNGAWIDDKKGQL